MITRPEIKSTESIENMKISLTVIEESKIMIFVNFWAKKRQNLMRNIEKITFKIETRR